jgi:5-oxoprolinase (ATP-hydrolysing)
MNTRWQFWIDVGGTFTDCVAVAPDGQQHRVKVLSSGQTYGTAGVGSTGKQILDPARREDRREFWRGYRLQLIDARGEPIDEAPVARFDPQRGALELERSLPLPQPAGYAYALHGDEEAPLLAIRRILGLAKDDTIPPVSVRLGTTRGTNAFVTHTGARTALVTTRGFADVLHIGTQNRPRLFDLEIRKPEPVFERVLEVDERVAADGTVLKEPDPDLLPRQLIDLKQAGIEALAVCLLHSYLFPRHEELIGAVAAEIGFREVSLSHRVAPLIKIVPRGETTVANAYLNPVLSLYVERIRGLLGPESDLRLLTSAGGLVQPQRFQGKDSLLSGPAGGAVGFSRAAQSAGFTRAIGLDMGGTSTDVSRFDGQLELVYETEKDGLRILSPMLAIETIAAGGGSVCRFDGVKLVVGPESAGAEPGPACYGRGGPLCVTDMNLALGRILADRFPFPLNTTAVQCQLSSLAEQIRCQSNVQYGVQELAEGFVSVANANMVKAIRAVSVAKGADPREYTLVAFGGAAPQHACAVARQLGMSSILNHPDGGILSAVGIGLADVVKHQVAGVYRRFESASLHDAKQLLKRLARRVEEECLAEGVLGEQVNVTCALDLRYVGRDAYLTIPQPPDGDYRGAYDAEHRRLHGYVDTDGELEIVAARATGIGRIAERSEVATRVARYVAQPQEVRAAFFDGEWRETVLFDRRALRPGAACAGPAIVADPYATVVVDPGWEAEMLSDGQLLLVDRQSQRRPTVATTLDPVMLEVFNSAFTGIAEEMGITLRNTASSVNVKERLDFSCALFTPSGDLVVNAPHIPVHLGAMSETVRCVLQDSPDLAAGDVVITNDPFRGGSHLPDITVVTPVFGGQPERLLFFTASRAHHAEIGGIVPGSMPPFSKNLAEEGVLIRGMKIVQQGRFRQEAIRSLLACSPYPSRSVKDNLADIQAQIAANRQGAIKLEQLIARYGLDVVHAYMQHIQDAAETKVRHALRALPDGHHTFSDCLDDGSRIQVTVTIQGDSASIDFAGSAGVHAGNLNANPSIVRAAVIYCLRCLIAEDIPLNEGILHPLDLRIPEGILAPPPGNDPRACAAVVGGNVETSQRIVDVLLGALGRAAASQGTMNNLLFGDATFGYYETICGGAGATPWAHGADAVHTHMTNTRLTDPEILEQRYPVRLHEFRIRRGSGGAGRHRGGDGVVRRIEFLRSLILSLLTQRRGAYPPFGLEGGQAGSIGRNTLIRAKGSEERLAGQAQLVVAPGDTLIVETPGGGGWGRRTDSNPFERMKCIPFERNAFRSTRRGRYESPGNLPVEYGI